ncbi:MAG: hypothetical protein U0L06_12225 [Agathobacter sp.]|nr:hypothetical protein [Agathobacter sp.]
MSADCAGKALKKSIGVNNIEWMLDLVFGKRHTAEIDSGTCRRKIIISQIYYFEVFNRIVSPLY